MSNFETNRDDEGEEFSTSLDKGPALLVGPPDHSHNEKPCADSKLVLDIGRQTDGQQ